MVNREGKTVAAQGAGGRLAESEAFLKKVLSSSLNGLYVFDWRTQTYIYINDQYTKITGYTIDDLNSFSIKGFFDLFHPEDIDKVKKHVASMKGLAEGEVKEIEYRFRSAKGEWCWYLSQETVFSRGPDGSVSEVIGTFLDITDRKNAEETLRKSEEQIHAIFESVADGIAVFDMEGSLILLNEAEAKLVGYEDVDEMKRDLDYFANNYVLTTSDRKVVPLEDWPVSKALRGESFTDYRLWAKRLDIDKEWFISFSGSPVIDKGIQTHAVVVSRDITEEKKSEEIMRKNDAEMTSLIDAMPVLVVRYDPGVNVIMLNSEFKKVTGWDEEDAKRHGLMNLAYPDENLRREVQEYMDRVGADWREFPLMTKSGKPIPVSWSNIRLDNGTQVGLGVDLSRLHDAERRLRETNEELMKVNRLKSTILRDVAHDLKQPITAMKLAASAISFEASKGQGLERIKTYSQTIAQALAGFERNMNSVLELGKLQSVTGLAKKSEDLNMIIKRVADDHRKAAIDKGLKVMLDLGAIPKVDMDADMISSLFTNLLQNAIKYTDRGHIIISTRATDHTIITEVSDTGIGISEEVIDKLFEPYFRVKSKTSGLGVGLAICKKIAELHGAAIHVRSSIGEGSTFSVMFPLKNERDMVI